MAAEAVQMRQAARDVMSKKTGEIPFLPVTMITVMCSLLPSCQTELFGQSSVTAKTKDFPLRILLMAVRHGRTAAWIFQR